ncbi:hypothetical protein CEP52_016999, partial [Fusarium oligoseptatum]
MISPSVDASRTILTYRTGTRLFSTPDFLEALFTLSIHVQNRINAWSLTELDSGRLE